MNTFESYSNTNTSTDDVQDHVASALSGWPEFPWAMGDYSCSSVPQSTHSDLIPTPGQLSTAGSYVPGFNATDSGAFTLVPTTELGMFTDLPTTPVDYAYQNAADPWTLAPPLFNENSAVSPLPPVGEPYWVEVAPLAPYSATTTPDLGVGPTSTTPTSLSQDECQWAWNYDLLQPPCMIQASSSGHGGETEWVASEPGVNLSEVTTFQAQWDTSEFSWHNPAALNHVVPSSVAPIVALGKRHREEEEPQGDEGLVGAHTHEVPPQKRARGGGRTKGILKAARSAARTHHELVARIPKTMVDCKPKAAGRGAERLATPSAQGIYHQPLPGPSSQWGWVVDAADGKPIWDEGSVDEEVAHHVDNTVEQYQKQMTNKPFEIPHIIEPEHRLLLQASEADFARGTVQVIKCRLCPNTNLKDFQEFKRHCNFTETHPLVIHFCDQCGDFFARPDSLVRHVKQRPPECRRITPEEAAQKRMVTEEAHDEFIRKLKHGLKMGQDIGKPFSRIIKDKYPKSSKKRKGNGNGNERSRR